MFCPNCGQEENQNTQYCRSCGSDLHVVRSVIDLPGTGAGSADAARVEIGKALAKQIESVQSAKDLKRVTETVLPNINKFLETSQEKRLRRIRRGSIITFVGLGAAIGFLIAALFGDPDVIVMSAMGFVTLFIGLAITINGFFFTVPKGQIEAGQGESVAEMPGHNTNELLMPPSARGQFRSVTENTTRTLDKKIPVERDSSAD